MWPRAIELMLGVWLLVSPFVFRHVDDPTLLAVDLSVGASVVALSAISFWSRAHRAHLATLALSLGVAAFGWLGHAHPSPAGYQNLMLVGLTLALFAIIPSHSNEPPPDWRRYYEDKARRRVELDAR